MKEKSPPPDNLEKQKDSTPKTVEDSATWAEDQKKHSYYYDDDTGYKVYNPDEDDED